MNYKCPRCEKRNQAYIISKHPITKVLTYQCICGVQFKCRNNKFVR